MLECNNTLFHLIGHSVIHHHFDHLYENAIVTDSVELNQHQDQRMVEFFSDFLNHGQDSGFAELFVHKLTQTNINKKELVSLNIGNSSVYVYFLLSASINQF